MATTQGSYFGKQAGPTLNEQGGSQNFTFRGHKKSKI